MDQLKKQLAVVMQYGFWIGSSIVLLGSLGVWYMSTSDLSSQSNSQLSKIKSDVQKVTNLRSSMTDQPNEKSHVEMQKMIEEREDEVLRAWSSIYQDQRRILTWPKTKELREDFIDEFRHPKDPETGVIDKSRQKLPYEKYVKFPVEESQKVPQFILRNYERYIGKVMPDIAAIAKAEWTAEFDAKAASSSGEMGDYQYGASNRDSVSITGQKEGPLVEWSQTSQEAVLKDLFPWRGRRPNTLEVYYSQENLWILKQLLEIVAEVNGNARQPFEAKIREIDQLSIGKSVIFGAGALDTPGAEFSGGMSGMRDMYSSSMDEGMSSETGMSMGADPDSDPADNRYVDTTLKPITGSQLRGALASNSPNDASLAVAKRVPVMMSLKMDQRFVPKLLAECGSAPLMVDVRQVRVLPKGKQSVAGAGGSMDGGMGDMDSGSEMGGSYGGGYGGSATPMMDEKDEFPMDMTIEVYGLIYIYNPPNREALGVDQVTEDTKVDGTKVGDAVETSTESALPPPTTPTPPADTATPPADTATPPADTTAPPDDTATPPEDAAPSGDATPVTPDEAAPPGEASAQAPPVAITSPSPLAQ